MGVGKKLLDNSSRRETANVGRQLNSMIGLWISLPGCNVYHQNALVLDGPRFSKIAVVVILPALWNIFPQTRRLCRNFGRRA